MSGEIIRNFSTKLNEIREKLIEKEEQHTEKDKKYEKRMRKLNFTNLH